MQEARDDVYRRFCEARVAVDEGLRTPEDHLSFEFEFMAAQAGEQARACMRRYCGCGICPSDAARVSSRPSAELD